MQGSKGDTDIKNRLLDSVGEGERIRVSLGVSGKEIRERRKEITKKEGRNKERKERRKITRVS